MDASSEHDRPDDSSGDAPPPDVDASDAGPAPEEAKPTSLQDGLKTLPPYARSLLRIKLPVIVKLAATKQPVGRILELGPGTILQFDKSCEETLTLEIGEREVAVGEAVKVGEKFGLRITSMIMPMERFHIVGRAAVPKSA